MLPTRGRAGRGTKRPRARHVGRARRRRARAGGGNSAARPLPPLTAPLPSPSPPHPLRRPQAAACARPHAARRRPAGGGQPLPKRKVCGRSGPMLSMSMALSSILRACRRRGGSGAERSAAGGVRRGGRTRTKGSRVPAPLPDIARQLSREPRRGHAPARGCRACAVPAPPPPNGAKGGGERERGRGGGLKMEAALRGSWG